MTTFKWVITCNEKPCEFWSNWANAKFDTLEEAVDYFLAWMHPYVPKNASLVELQKSGLFSSGWSFYADVYKIECKEI